MDEKYIGINLSNEKSKSLKKLLENLELKKELI